MTLAHRLHRVRDEGRVPPAAPELLVGAGVDDRRAARAEDARDLAEHPAQERPSVARRVGNMVEHLVHHRRVEARVLEGQRLDPRLVEGDRASRRAVELRARDFEHCGVEVHRVDGAHVGAEGGRIASRPAAGVEHVQRGDAGSSPAAARQPRMISTPMGTPGAVVVRRDRRVVFVGTHGGCG